jgi:hypothetical protein
MKYDMAVYLRLVSDVNILLQHAPTSFFLPEGVEAFMSMCRCQTLLFLIELLI